MIALPDAEVERFEQEVFEAVRDAAEDAIAAVVARWRAEGGTLTFDPPDND